MISDGGGGKSKLITIAVKSLKLKFFKIDTSRKICENIVQNWGKTKKGAKRTQSLNYVGET